MGLNSCSLWARALSCSASMPEAAATCSISLSECGKNSCRGGSSRRTVTGKPRITSKIPSKSERCIGNNLSNANRRPASSSARIISRTAMIRSASKNICSVRQRPTPSAPKSRATCTSCGVSALARTVIRRTLSAHPIKVAKSPDNTGWRVATAPRNTFPSAPSTVMRSPFLTTRPPTENCSAPESIFRSPAPQTQGRPMPRATTAACDVIPPRAVTIADAACMP